MALVRGENVIVYVYDGGFWKPVVCGRSCSLSTNRESIETSITGSGIWRTNVYNAASWSGTIDGITYLQMVNTLALPDMRALQYAGVYILFRYQRTDDAANVYTDEGTALIKNVIDTGDYQNLNTFSIELLGSGPLTAIFTPTPVNPSGKVKRYQTTGNGTDTINSSLLINKDVLDITIDGAGRCNIILSGTPVNQEAKYTIGSGDIQSAQVIDSATNIYVLYQDI